MVLKTNNIIWSLSCTINTIAIKAQAFSKWQTLAQHEEMTFFVFFSHSNDVPPSSHKRSQRNGQLTLTSTSRSNSFQSESLYDLKNTLTFGSRWLWIRQMIQSGCPFEETNQRWPDSVSMNTPGLAETKKSLNKYFSWM